MQRSTIDEHISTSISRAPSLLHSSSVDTSVNKTLFCTDLQWRHTLDILHPTNWLSLNWQNTFFPVTLRLFANIFKQKSKYRVKVCKVNKIVRSCNAHSETDKRESLGCKPFIPLGNYDNLHRSRPITISLFRIPYTLPAILKLHPQFVKSMWNSGAQQLFSSLLMCPVWTVLETNRHRQPVEDRRTQIQAQIQTTGSEKPVEECWRNWSRGAVKRISGLCSQRMNSGLWEKRFRRTMSWVCGPSRRVSSVDVNLVLTKHWCSIILC